MATHKKNKFDAAITSLINDRQYSLPYSVLYSCAQWLLVNILKYENIWQHKSSIFKKKLFRSYWEIDK